MHLHQLPSHTIQQRLRRITPINHHDNIASDFDEHHKFSMRNLNRRSFARNMSKRKQTENILDKKGKNNVIQHSQNMKQLFECN